MSNHVIPENPQFSLELPKLKTTDRAHADIFNDINKKLIENDAYLEKEIRNIPKTPINNTLTSDSETEALSAKQGKILHETKLGKTETAANSEKLNNKAASEYALVTSLADKLTNKKRTMSAEDLNNPNYPEPYITSTDLGLQIGLPTVWAFIQYFRHENNDGYGLQIAYKLDRSNQENKNDKLWTMKIRVATALNWGPWETVQTSTPFKGHYPINDCNLALEDGMHYYVISSAINKPVNHDGILSVYAYSVGDSENSIKNPFLIQMYHTWWGDKIFYRRGLNGQWGDWHEILTANNSVFSIGTDGITMSDHSKHLRIRHIEGATTEGLDGELFLNFYNGKNIKFKALDGSIQTLQGLFQSGREYKTAIANKLTTKGIPTSTDASWPTLINNIDKLGNVTRHQINYNGQNIPGFTVITSQGRTQTIVYNTNGRKVKAATMKLWLGSGDRAARSLGLKSGDGEYLNVASYSTSEEYCLFSVATTPQGGENIVITIEDNNYGYPPGFQADLATLLGGYGITSFALTYLT